MLKEYNTHNFKTLVIFRRHTNLHRGHAHISQHAKYFIKKIKMIYSASARTKMELSL